MSAQTLEHAARPLVAGDNESKSNAKDDLKSLPMPELQAELGSSPDGLSVTRGVRNGWPNMGSMRLKKRKPIRSCNSSAISGDPSRG